jgi:beta-N-acetylhexosaminidase
VDDSPSLLPVSRAAAVIALGALLAASCGGGDEDDGGAVDTRAASSGAQTVSQEPVPERARMSLADALGQLVVARYAGPTPTRTLLRRIERGQVGGVILFADNVQSTTQVRESVLKLDAASRRGGHPKVLVMVDQEGGLVKRLPGPPSRAAAAMRDPQREGERTGRMLRTLGIDVNLAPVADVARAGSFLGSRAFGTRPGAVASRACAFARGLRNAGVAPTLKHFPGLGSSRVNTDDRPATIDLSARELRRGYLAYQQCAHVGSTLVMVSSAVYPRAIGRLPAVMSRVTYTREMGAAGGRALTISDDLETPALAVHSTPARRALSAGLDLLLYARTEQASASAYRRLLADARAGRIPQRRVRESATRVLALKAELAR